MLRDFSAIKAQIFHQKSGKAKKGENIFCAVNSTLKQRTNNLTTAKQTNKHKKMQKIM